MPRGLSSNITTQLNKAEIGSIFYLVNITLADQTLYLAERGNGTLGYYGEVLTDTPIAYYRLGETSGTTAVDSINAYNLTHVNTPTLGVGGFIPGDNNRAVTYNGTDGHSLRSTNTAALEGLTNITVEALIKYTSLPGSVNSIASRRRSTGGVTNKFWEVFLDSGGVLKFRVSDASTETTISSLYIVPADTVTHIAVTLDGSDVVFYVNGVQERSVPYASNLKTTDNLSTTNLVVGANDNGAADFFAGTIDELAIYSTALNATRVSEHFRAIGQAFVVNNNGYSAKLLNISGISNSLGGSDSVTVSCANLDGYFTTLDQLQSFFAAPIEILEYVISPDGTVNDTYTKWKGTCDEIGKITQEQVDIPATTGTPTTRMQAPRGFVGVQCRWVFANLPTASSEITTSTLSTVNFEGYECRYGYTGTIGFRGTLNAGINNSVTSLVVDLPSGDVTAGFKFEATDVIIIDSEKLLVTAATAVSSNQQTLTVARGWLDTTAASHSSSAVVYFKNCQKAIDSCKRRGMYGNNPNDTY